MSTPEDIATDTQNPSQGSSANTPKIDYEKRYKDTQASYTKSQQEKKALEAKVKILEELTAPKVVLTSEQQQELDDLKFSDPDAWRNKMNTLEQDAIKKYQDTINGASREASLQAELERRAQVLADFNQSHKLNITDETIQFDVPPRFTKKLESGEISFEDFLAEVKEYLETPKKVGTPNKKLGQPNLSNVGGDDTPTKDAQNKSVAEQYKNITF